LDNLTNAQCNLLFFLIHNTLHSQQVSRSGEMFFCSKPIPTG
jgi:hypothetical protein